MSRGSGRERRSIARSSNFAEVYLEELNTTSGRLSVIPTFNIDVEPEDFVSRSSSPEVTVSSPKFTDPQVAVATREFTVPSGPPKRKLENTLPSERPPRALARKSTYKMPSSSNLRPNVPTSFKDKARKLDNDPKALARASPKKPVLAPRASVNSLKVSQPAAKLPLPSKVMIPRRAKAETTIQPRLDILLHQDKPVGLPEGSIGDLDSLWLSHWKWFEKNRLECAYDATP